MSCCLLFLAHSSSPGPPQQMGAASRRRSGPRDGLPEQAASLLLHCCLQARVGRMRCEPCVGWWDPAQGLATLIARCRASQALQQARGTYFGGGRGLGLGGGGRGLGLGGGGRGLGLAGGGRGLGLQGGGRGLGLGGGGRGLGREGGGRGLGEGGGERLGMAAISQTMRAALSLAS